MTKFSSLSIVALVTALAMASPVFAASPTFVNAAPGTGMSVDAFASELSVFNGNEINDLLHATKVTVYSFNTAWTDKAGKAVGLLTDNSGSISRLRAALDKNPEAVRLLAAHNIKVDQVVDIIDGGSNVQLYIQ